jgi:CBS-domain-containing membrane protein
MLKVKDIMTKNVYTLEFDASAEEAASGLTRRQVGAAPVKNRERELVGILTRGTWWTRSRISGSRMHRCLTPTLKGAPRSFLPARMGTRSPLPARRDR